MVSLERVLFDTNEALHHMGILANDKYITETTLAFATLITFILAPLIGRIGVYIIALDPSNKYTPAFIIGGIFMVFYISKEYHAIVIILILFGLYYIVNTYPYFRDIKNYIDRFF